MADPMNIKLEPVDMGLELGRIQDDLNQSNTSEPKPYSEPNAEAMQRFALQGKELQGDNAGQFSARVNQEIPIPNPPANNVFQQLMQEQQQIYPLSKSQLRMFACAAAATDQIQQQRQWLQQKDQQIQQQNQYITSLLRQEVEFARHPNIQHQQRNVQGHNNQPYHQH